MSDRPKPGRGDERSPRVEEKPFEALALPHLDAVYRFARRLTGDVHEAEDLVQETYLKAFKAFGSFEVREFGIKPWLMKILHNSFLNRRAKEKNAPHAVDQQALEQVHASEIDGGSEIPPSLDTDNLDEEVKRALSQLSPDFRSVLLLWATKEYSYQEIADIVSVPVGTVMSRLHRARCQLVRLLETFVKENRIPTAVPEQE